MVVTGALVATVARAQEPVAPPQPVLDPGDALPFIAPPQKRAKGVQIQPRPIRTVERGPVFLLEPVPWSVERLQGLTADPAVSRLVSQLGSASFTERDAATVALQDQNIPDIQLWLHLAGMAGPLSNEAHTRLLEIGRRRIVDAPRGALGIQMAQRFGEMDGVTVTALIPNMPAQKVLKPGDRIIELDKRPIAVSSQLSEIVQTKRPGQKIAVIIMRGERDELGRVKGGADGRPLETRIELEMEVGSRADLAKFGDGGMDSPLYESGRDKQANSLLEAFPVPVRMLPATMMAGEKADVDCHPDIVQLKAMLARPESLGGGAGVRAVLRARLESLQAAARIPGLTADEQQWLTAVAERFLELIPLEYRPK